MHPLHVPAPKPPDDAERVSVLRGLALLDSERELCFDRITESASKCFQVPICLVSLVDLGRQWFKSVVGVDVCETSRNFAFCGHAILPDAPRIFQVPNALEDDRFKYSDLVTGPPHIRFYAGAPLVYTDEGGSQYRLGTLCIIDTKPRELTEDQMHLLETLARLCITEIELRHQCRRKMESEQVDAVKNAEIWAKEMNGEYIGQVAHDLRTPLNSFSMGLQALGETVLDAEQRDLLETLSVSAELMSLTCTKAIDYTRHIAGRGIQPTRGPFDLTHMLRKCLRIVMSYTHGSRAVTYIFVVKAGVSPWVYSDQDWVWQMTMNYLSNARKFTTEGHIKTTVDLTNKNTLRISIADTGIGVGEQDLDALFKPFGQLQDFSGGTGLGLFSVQEKAHKLGGRCGVDVNHENNGKGSLFWFEIPYVPWEEGESAAARVHRMQQAGLGCPVSPAVSPAGRGLAAARAAAAAASSSAAAACGSASAAAAALPQQQTLTFGQSFKNDSNPHAAQGWDTLDNGDLFIQTSEIEREVLAGSCSDTDGMSRDGSWEGQVGEEKNESPVNSPTSRPMRAVSTPLPLRRSDVKKQHVLVVEDDVSTRMLMVHGIKRKGYQVDQADNGEEGLAKMKAKLFNIVFCDIMMPVMDGCECVRRLRAWEEEEDRKIRQFVVALSANTDHSDVGKYLASGMNKFYPKPIKIKELLLACADDFLELDSEPDEPETVQVI